jgi:hypothetical protein
MKDGKMMPAWTPTDFHVASAQKTDLVFSNQNLILMASNWKKVDRCSFGMRVHSHIILPTIILPI